MTKYRCNNCPLKPTFLTIDALNKHWDATHTVSMEETVHDPWNERPDRVIKHYEEITDG
jgi:hypothetical protein